MASPAVKHPDCKSPMATEAQRMKELRAHWLQFRFKGSSGCLENIHHQPMNHVLPFL